MRVLSGQDQYVADWAGLALGVVFQEPFTAFGFLESEEMRGAVVFNDYYPGGNIEITYVGPHSLRRSQISFMCKYAFLHVGASRVTARTRRDNLRMNTILRRFGFVFEGVQRRFYGLNAADDGIVYVLWPEVAARWMEDLN